MVKAVKNYLKLLPFSAQIVAIMLGLAVFFGGVLAFGTAYPAAFAFGLLGALGLMALACLGLLVHVALGLDD